MASIISASTTSGTALNLSGDTTGVLQIATGATPTTAVTIDTSQKVGIGTTSPSEKLHVVGSIASSDVFIPLNSTTAIGYIGNSNPITGGSSTNVGIRAESAMLFATGGATERMRIDSSGVVLVGTSSYNTSVTATCKFQVQNNGGDWCGAFQNNSAGTTYGLYVRYLNSAPNNTGSEFLYCNDSSTLRAVIRSNGGLANYQANNANLSDERLKTDILPATTYLDKICSIPVVTFKYKDQTDEELNLGVIAQDVDKVAPELVDHSGFGETPEGESPYLAIYQTDLQYALMKCIQEQQTIINDLKARVTALEGASN